MGSDDRSGGQVGWTGRALSRLEDDALLRGAAAFTADLPHPWLDGALHVAFVRSPYAHARLTGIDPAPALAMPGVAGVVTAADLEHCHPSPFGVPIEGPEQQPILPSAVVRFAGQAVAAVVAATAAQAADAAEQVIVGYEPLTPTLDIGTALEASAVEATRVTTGDAAGALDDAEIAVTQVIWSPRQTPAAIEPRAVAAAWNGDELHVWSATQKPHGFRDSLALFLGADPSTVHVVAPQVGGGFGGKVSRTAEEHLVPLLARLFDRPVRWNETRSENFATATHCRGEHVEITLAGGRDGRLTALRAVLVKDGGAYPLVGLLLPDGYTRPMANGCYDIEHVEFGSVGVLTNRPPTSAYRGAGRSPYVNALERAVDIYAASAGLDPADVRRRNLIRPEQMPYRTPTGGLYDEAAYPPDLERALELVGYEELRAEQQRRRHAGDGRLLGIGIATYNHMTTGGGGEEALVAIRPDGSALVVTGSTSQGHGHATTWAQIAADALGMDPSEVTVVEGDTDAIATGVGAVGSRSLQTAGVAVHRAATEVHDRARELAARLLEAAPEDITATPGVGLHVVGTPGIAVGWAELASVGLGTPDELSCGDFYDTEGRNTYPSGCCIAVIELDPATGHWSLERFVGVDDAGPRVNPMIVDGQLHGGIAGGVGQVLGEVLEWDEDGNPLTTTFADYPLITAEQLPSFELEASATTSSFNDLGWKGVGESGTVGATAATHNAVIDALAHLGVTHIDLPCTPRRVWEAIRSVSG
jgi:carbon-monoxide dehydrogenase large subunit